METVLETPLDHPLLMVGASALPVAPTIVEWAAGRSRPLAGSVCVCVWAAYTGATTENWRGIQLRCFWYH